MRMRRAIDESKCVFETVGRTTRVEMIEMSAKRHCGEARIQRRSLLARCYAPRHE